MSRELLSIREAAWQLQAPEGRIRQLVQSGEVPSMKFSGHLVIDPDDLPTLAERIGMDERLMSDPSARTADTSKELLAFASGYRRAMQELDQHIQEEGEEKYKPVLAFLESLHSHQAAVLAGQEEVFTVPDVSEVSEGQNEPEEQITQAAQRPEKPQQSQQRKPSKPHHRMHV